MGVLMNLDAQISELKSVLDAFPSQAVNEALKLRGQARRGERTMPDGWEIWDGEGLPPKGFEWRELNGVVYARRAGQHQGQATSEPAKAKPRQKAKPAEAAAVKYCPDCGAIAYPQKVCPACAKGKAGIRRMWICGEKDDHVFYTE